MTSPPPHMPIALTIAGSDSGGGAGIQADLKTFASLGVFGTSAVTAITAQNPAGVTAIQGIEPEVVGKQIAAVMDYFPVGAVKIGMLFSAEIIAAVAEALLPRLTAPGGGRIPLVVDPVMVATSGAKLLNEDAMGAMEKKILPLASLLTPNMDEAALLAGRAVTKPEHLEQAAVAIHQRFQVPVLVKGGHLAGSAHALDVLWDGNRWHRFETPFLLRVGTHGTGCTLSSAIAVYLMGGKSLAEAVGEAKAYLQDALANALSDGRGTTLNHAVAPRPLRAGP